MRTGFRQIAIRELVAALGAANREALGNLQATNNGSPGRDCPTFTC